MPPKPFSLATFVDLLLGYEKGYHASKGDKHAKILDDLIGEITSHPKYNFEGTKEELKQVNLQFSC